jgi:hypothetical protein
MSTPTLEIHNVVRMVIDTRRLVTADGTPFMVDDYTIFDTTATPTLVMRIYHDDGLSVVHNVEPSPR